MANYLIICGAIDPHSPRVCDREPNHDGLHDDSTLPVGETVRRGKWSEAQQKVMADYRASWAPAQPSAVSPQVSEEQAREWLLAKGYEMFLSSHVGMSGKLLCENLAAFASSLAPANQSGEREQAIEPDMWWLWDDSEQEIDDPDEYLAEYAPEGELVRFMTAHRGGDKWAFFRDGKYFYFDSKDEAERALASRAPAAKEGE